MNGPLRSLEESVDRLVKALTAHEDPRAAIEDCATEMTDRFNNYAYTLEHENEDD